MIAKIQQLQYGAVYLFRDWPNPDVLRVAAGVYIVWQGGALIYAGMAGRSKDALSIALHREAAAKCKGLYSRLRSHASGRRSGDQFCVYVCDRLVLRELAPGEIRRVSEGKLSLDAMVRNYIHERLAYRFIEVADVSTALQVETNVSRGALPAGKPLFNML